MNLNRFTHLLEHTLMCLMMCVFLFAPLLGKAEEPSITPSAAVSESSATIHGDGNNEQAIQRMIQELVAQTEPATGAIVPVVALLVIFGGPVLILIALIFQHYRAQKLKAEFRRECVGKLIDAGKDVPAELLFFDDSGVNKTPEKMLSRGLNFLGLGLGITVFLSAVNSFQAGTFGLIFIGLGCAQLISWKLTRQTP